MNTPTANKLKSAGLIAGFVLTITLNALANILPLFGRATGEISDSLPNLFVPAGLTFSVWGVIYLALLIFTVYQALVVFRRPDDPPEWWNSTWAAILVSHLANALWIVAWHSLSYVISLLLMLVLFGALLVVVLRLGWSGTPLRGRPYWLAAVPFSIYIGWITVALPANVTGLLVAYGVNSIAPGPLFWAAALAAVAALLGVLVALLYRDGAYAGVISWAVLGIALKRAGDVPFLAGWSGALALVLAVMVIVAIAGPGLRRGSSLIDGGSAAK